MKKSFIILVILLLILSLLAACGPAENSGGETATDDEPVPADSHQDAAQTFLTLMLEDDAELQQAILDNVAAINMGMIAPTDEQRQAMNDAAARLDSLLRDRFGSLLTADQLDRRIRDGSLMQYQQLQAGTGAVLRLSDCQFSEDGSHLEYTAQVECVADGVSQSVPIQGEIDFDAAGLIEYFNADSLGQLSKVLTAAGR